MLLQRLSTWTKEQFFAQYYNNPNDPGNYAIDPGNFQYYDKRFLTQEAGNWWFKDRRLNIYAAVDFAFSRSKKADYTAIVVIGMDMDKNVYVLDVERFRTDKIKTYFDQIVRLHSRWDLAKLRAEVTVAQKVIVNQLRSEFKSHGILLTIDEHNPSRHQGDKEERMQAILEPAYSNGMVWHFKGGNCQLLEYEVQHAHPAHDDMKDALSSAIEIAVAPRRRAKKPKDSNVIYHSRFGGVAYGGSYGG